MSQQVYLNRVLQMLPGVAVRCHSLALFKILCAAVGPFALPPK